MDDTELDKEVEKLQGKINKLLAKFNKEFETIIKKVECTITIEPKKTYRHKPVTCKMEKTNG